MGWGFANTTYPVARKEYVCEACGTKIAKGEKHYKLEGVWDGEWSGFRMHQHCREAELLVNEALGLDGYDGEDWSCMNGGWCNDEWEILMSVRPDLFLKIQRFDKPLLPVPKQSEVSDG